MGSKQHLLFLLLLPFLLAACVTREEEAVASAEAAQAVTTAAPTDTAGLDATLEAAGVIETRQPVPTVTPGVITKTVDNLATQAHIDEFELFGLSGSDWINIGVSLLIVLLSYLIGSWLVKLLTNYITPFLKAKASPSLLFKVGSMLKWTIVLFGLHLATIRLLFLSVGVKVVLTDIYFVIALLLVTRGLWYLIDLANLELSEHLSVSGRAQDMAPAQVLLVRLLRALLILISATILLSHFGINMTAFAALLGIGGLAFSLAARDTIEDAIAGVIILADQPFRVGDRIEVAAANTWGDVVDIGLRTTRIRTRDNRLVIIPNSLISKNEIINYTFPDPTYRIETHVGLDYHTDIEKARAVMIAALQKVPSVLEDRPIDVLYSDMGDSAMIFRVRWWVETYADTRRVTDQVHTALQHALDEAGIVSPFPTQSIFVHGEPPLKKDGRAAQVE